MFELGQGVEHIAGEHQRDAPPRLRGVGRVRGFRS